MHRGSADEVGAGAVSLHDIGELRPGATSRPVSWTERAISAALWIGMFIAVPWALAMWARAMAGAFAR